MKYGAIFIVLLLLVGLGYSMFQMQEEAGTRLDIPNEYQSEALGIAFLYPQAYVLTEVESEIDGISVTEITLIQESDAGISQGGEGPRAVTIDFVATSSEQASLVDWVRTSNESNFTLGNGSYATTTVNGRASMTYRWSGLYPGETTAFSHAGGVLLVAVTYDAPTDDILRAYQMVLKTIALRD